VDGVLILDAVTIVSLLTCAPSQNNGEARMESACSGGTPASNYGRTGDLQMG
jgi:hypothetical protein